ncbi:MAG TPA: DJ-1/PfpI family protein [Xanthobacteraceae bacterium]|jgi:cyclohexyl-isocyanide hydratase|nr:DJ-1/PfpI family protein [Xanthobacteraceae bacterium]
MSDTKPLQIGFLIFRDLTQLDFTGPYEVFARLPDTRVHIVAKSSDPVRSDRGLLLVPTVTCAACPPLDVIVVPGGPGQQALMDDEEALGFVRAQAKTARYVTSVCTGALVLGAAGLLRGYRATTHWLSLPLLEAFGAVAVDERVVIDRNRVTGGGITAGIDFGLRLAAELRGEAVAQQIQLQMEYSPAPPFDAGSPATAPKDVVEAVRRAAAPLVEKRQKFADQWRQDEMTRNAAVTRAASG